MTKKTSKYSRVIPPAFISAIMKKAVDNRRKLLELEALYRMILRECAATDFASFLQYVITDPKRIDPLTGRHAHIELQPFHEEWAEAIQCLYNIPETLNYLTQDEAEKLNRNKKLLVLSPRETGKTFIFGVGHFLWRLGWDPNARIGNVSKARPQARRPLSTIRQYILGSRDLHDVFPELKPKSSLANPNERERWTLDEIIVERSSNGPDSSICSYGTSSKSLLGARFDLLNGDDLLAWDGKMSETEIKSGIEWYENNPRYALSQGSGDGIEVVVGTPWHPADLLAYLQAEEDFVVLKYSVELQDRDNGYRLIEWPERLTPKRLESEKHKNIVAFNRNRRCIVSSPDEQLFSAAIKRTLKQDWNPYEIAHWQKFGGMDLSTAKRKGTSLVAAAARPDGQMKAVIGVEAGAWEPDVKAQKITDFGAVYNPDLIYVETNALQGDVMTLLIASGNTNLPIQGHQTTREKHNQLETLALEMTNGLWRFALPECSRELVEKATGLCDCDWCRFVNEVMKYPNYTSNDMLMAWLFSSNAMRDSVGAGSEILTFNLGGATAGDSNPEMRLIERSRKRLVGLKHWYYGNAHTGNKFLTLTPETAKDAKNIQEFIVSTVNHEHLAGIETSDIYRDLRLFNRIGIDKPEEFDDELFHAMFRDMAMYYQLMNGKAA